MFKKQTKETNWADKNVLITGVQGFLGSWLCKNLVDRKAKVVGLTRDLVSNSNFYIMDLDKKTTLVKGDVADYHTVERIMNEYDIEVVFHIAAQPIVGIANRSPLSTFESNIKGTWTVLEAVRNSKTVQAIVTASSDKAYGTQKELPYKENARLHGLHPYDVTKSCSDLLAQTYHNTYGLPVGITRCGNFYGGGDLNFSRIIPDTIRSLFHNKRPVIRSNGKYIRDYIYVKDVANAYLILAEKLKNQKIRGHAFNFSNETPINVIDLVSKIIKLYGKPNLKPKVLNIVKSEILNQYLSSEKARNMLGWNPIYSLDDGLKETIQWYNHFLRGNFDELKK